MQHTVYYHSDSLQTIAQFSRPALDVYLAETKRIAADPEILGRLIPVEENTILRTFYFDVTLSDGTTYRTKYSVYSELHEMFISDVWATS